MTNQNQIKVEYWFENKGASIDEQNALLQNTLYKCANIIDNRIWLQSRIHHTHTGKNRNDCKRFTK